VCSTIDIPDITMRARRVASFAGRVRVAASVSQHHGTTMIIGRLYASLRYLSRAARTPTTFSPEVASGIFCHSLLLSVSLSFSRFSPLRSDSDQSAAIGEAGMPTRSASVKSRSAARDRRVDTRKTASRRCRSRGTSARSKSSQGQR